MPIQKISALVKRADPVLSRGAAGSMVVNACGIVVALALQVLLARVMEVRDFGVYQYVISWCEILLIFALFGVDSLNLRYIAAYLAKKEWGLLRGVINRGTQLCLSASLIALILMSVVLYFVQDLLKPGVGHAFQEALFFIPIWAFTLSKLTALRALRHPVLSRLTEIVIRPILVATMVAVSHFVIQRTVSAELVIGFHMAAMLAILVLVKILLIRSTPEEVRLASPQYDDKIWVRTAFGLMLVAGTTVTLNLMDTIIIGVMCTLEEVAVYATASRLSVLIPFGLHAVSLVTAPLISEHHAAKSREELQRFISEAGIWVFLITLPVVLGLVFFGKYALALFGQEYVSGYILLLMLTAGQYAFIAVGPTAFILTMTGNEKRGLRIMAFTILVNLAMLVPAIKFFGIKGAAASTGLAFALRSLLTWRAVKQELGVDSSIFYALFKLARFRV